uniref:Uncharacterized protein n=1 Tax=Sphaerodactylus townsendi TaxID=933632 RepID=A0ACB8G489_9SAUR
MLEERALSPETTEEVERLVTLAQESGTLPRVTFNTPEKLEEEPCHRKLAKLTTKYNRKDLQRWRDLEEWIDTQLQELYQYQVGWFLTPSPAPPMVPLPPKEQKKRRGPDEWLCPPSPSGAWEMAGWLRDRNVSSPPDLAEEVQLEQQSSSIPRLLTVIFHKLQETDATAAPEPEIDIEDLLEVPNEEQKSRLQEILHTCSRPTEDFVAELLDRLRGLRKIANPQRK